MTTTTKRPIFSYAFFILLTAGIQFLGCKKTEDKTEGAIADTMHTQVATNPNAYVTEYTTYRTSTEQELARNRDTITSLSARLKSAKTKLKSDLEHDRMVLEQKNAELQTKLETYKDEGKDKWETFKSDFNRSLDSVRSGMKTLVGKIKKDDD